MCKPSIVLILLVTATLIGFNNCTGYKALKTDNLATLASSSLRCDSSGKVTFPRRAWRLTGSQYINSVKSIFTTVQNVGNPFSIEAVSGPFINNSDGLNLGLQITTNLIDENEKISSAAVDGLVLAYPCLTNAINATCSSTVVLGVVERLFRRPLTDLERSLYSQYLISSAAQFGNSDGIAAFVQAILLSPNFLFRYEVGDLATGRLEPYEMASLISFSAANVTPDDELLSAAKNGLLQTRAQIKDQFVRLAKKSSRYEVLIEFLRQYLRYGAITSKTKDALLFPDFNSDIAQALVDETDALILQKMKAGEGTLKELLSTDDVMVQPATAKIYSSSISNLPAGMTLTKDPNRAGLLTQPSLLASLAGSKNSSPVHVGKLIRTELLCGKIPSPPAAAPSLDEIPAADYPTQRARLAVHSTNKNCFACHQYMDPIGLGFENFDALGAFRTTENGYPVDDSGVVAFTNSETDGAFHGGAELGRRLASSGVVRSCVMKKSFLYVTGQFSEQGSECFVDQVRKATNNLTDSSDMVGIMADIFTEFLLAPRVGNLEN